MKALRKILALVVVVVAAFAFVACSGGKSAYDIAVANGFTGTETEWLASLKGDTGATGATGAQGATGATGAQGATGITGKSAYEIACEEDGFTGTEEEWLASLKGTKGDTGSPATADPVVFKTDDVAVWWKYESEDDTAWQIAVLLSDVYGYQNVYSITFDEAGGADLKDYTNLVYKTKKALPDCSRPGANFLGWFDTDDTLVGKAGDEIEVLHSYALTAKWSFNITWVLGDGSFYTPTLAEIKASFLADYTTYTGNTTVSKWSATSAYKVFTESNGKYDWLLDYFAAVNSKYADGFAELKKGNITPTIDGGGSFDGYYLANELQGWYTGTMSTVYGGDCSSANYSVASIADQCVTSYDIGNVETIEEGKAVTLPLAVSGTTSMCWTDGTNVYNAGDQVTPTGPMTFTAKLGTVSSINADDGTTFLYDDRAAWRDAFLTDYCTFTGKDKASLSASAKGFFNSTYAADYTLQVNFWTDATMGAKWGAVKDAMVAYLTGIGDDTNSGILETISAGSAAYWRGNLGCFLFGVSNTELGDTYKGYSADWSSDAAAWCFVKKVPTKVILAGTDTYELPTLYKKGFTFDGWVDGDGATITSLTIGKDATAKFTAIP